MKKWNPPKSPWNLVQEPYFGDEWKILVCCLLLNLTTHKQVRKILHELFRKYPGPASMAIAKEEDLKDLLRPLGLVNKRAKTLIRFSHEYLTKDWKTAKDLYGCGKYATMRFSLWNRFPKSKYIGIDPVMRHRRNTNNMRSQIKKPKKPSIVIEDKYKLHNLSYLSTAIEEATCVVAGSVFTHLAWESIKDFLYQLDPFFGRGGEIGFTIFLGDEYIENFTGGKNFYKRKDAYHAVVTTIEQYTDYCEEQGLQFTLLPYTYELLHDLIKNPEGDIAIASQHFCNIRRNI